MKRVFICSKYAGDVEHNVEVAKALCLKALAAGYAPIAPHLLYPQLLDDDKPAERRAGIAAGHAFLLTCQSVWLYEAEGVSLGMKDDLSCARDSGIPVEVVTL